MSLTDPVSEPNGRLQRRDRRTFEYPCVRGSRLARCTGGLQVRAGDKQEAEVGGHVGGHGGHTRVTSRVFIITVPIIGLTNIPGN